MKVYIIIPIYNTSRFLASCIKSVLRQSYKDLEIILVNDCSTDNSLEICRYFVKSNPKNVILINKEQNEGVDRARFSGLHYVFDKGETDSAIMFVDSDDLIAKDSIKKLVEEMYRTKAQVIEMTGMRFWGPFKRHLYFPLKPQVISQPRLFDEYYKSFFGINLLNVSMCGKLYKTELLHKAKLSPTNYRMGEDLMFNLRLFPHIKKYAIIDYPGYLYRLGGLTSGYNPTFWENLKQQFFEKREEAIKYKYHQAKRSLNIELKNILITALIQRITYLKETDEQLIEWLDNELDNVALLADIISLVNDGEQNHDLNLIAQKDTISLINLAKDRIHAGRYRRYIKKLIRIFIK